mgnify:FL=1
MALDVVEKPKKARGERKTLREQVAKREASIRFHERVIARLRAQIADLLKNEREAAQRRLDEVKAATEKSYGDAQGFGTEST